MRLLGVLLGALFVLVAAAGEKQSVCISRKADEERGGVSVRLEHAHVRAAAVDALRGQVAERVVFVAVHGGRELAHEFFDLRCDAGSVRCCVQAMGGWGGGAYAVQLIRFRVDDGEDVDFGHGYKCFDGWMLVGFERGAVARGLD